MRLFVTGGTGFIGSHFINHAHACSHEVVALRRSVGSRPRIELTKQPRWITSELGELKKEEFNQCDAIVHLAAHSMSYPGDTLENCIHWNVYAPLSFFESGLAGGVRRILVAGSCFEYGRAANRYERIPPSAPLEPTTNYSISKATASMAFTQFAIDNNVSLSLHRIFHVFGEGEAKDRFWPSLRQAALSGEDFPMSAGLQVRDFIPVQTVVEKLLKEITDNIVTPGVPFVNNLGTGNASTLIDFAKKWWHYFGAKGRLLAGDLPYRSNEIMRYVPEI